MTAENIDADTELTRRRTAEELFAIARMVRRLSPDRRDPERFHVEKDEAAKRLAALARHMEHGTDIGAGAFRAWGPFNRTSGASRP